MSVVVGPSLVRLRTGPREASSAPPHVRHRFVRNRAAGVGRPAAWAPVPSGAEGTARRASRRTPWALVNLRPLMERVMGSPEVVIGLIDGPVRTDHPDLTRESIQAVQSRGVACTDRRSAACFHGTFVAGILSANREAAGPGICPGCTLVVRPIFSEAGPTPHRLPAARPGDLSTAILDCIRAGARVLNVSAALLHASPEEHRDLQEVLDHACRRGVVVVAAAGNQALIGGSAITRHPWVVPVVGYDLTGCLTTQSNLGAAIGTQGLGGPGEGVTSLSSTGGSVTSGGTSVAAPFITGAFGLLLTAFPRATGADVRSAMTQSTVSRSRTIVPPLLDAWAAYRALSTAQRRR